MILNRLAQGLASRIRNQYYKALGVRIDGYAWLRKIEIPRQHRAIRLKAPCALDRGVVLLCSGPSTRKPKIVIGRGVYINRNAFIDASELIIIEDDVAIGPNVYITDHDHDISDRQRVLSNKLVSDPVVIEAGAWVGANVSVLKGVRIGRGAVIGAGSVVTKDIPEHTVAAGVPAKVLRHR